MPVREVPVNWQEIDGEFVGLPVALTSSNFHSTSRFQIGPILELVTNGQGYSLH